MALTWVLYASLKHFTSFIFISSNFFTSFGWYIWIILSSMEHIWCIYILEHHTSIIPVFIWLWVLYEYLYDIKHYTSMCIVYLYCTCMETPYFMRIFWAYFLFGFGILHILDQFKLQLKTPRFPKPNSLATTAFSKSPPDCMRLTKSTPLPGPSTNILNKYTLHYKKIVTGMTVTYDCKTVILVMNVCAVTCQSRSHFGQPRLYHLCSCIITISPSLHRLDDTMDERGRSTWRGARGRHTPFRRGTWHVFICCGSLIVTSWSSHVPVVSESTFSWWRH